MVALAVDGRCMCPVILVWSPTPNLPSMEMIIVDLIKWQDHAASGPHAATCNIFRERKIVVQL